MISNKATAALNHKTSIPNVGLLLVFLILITSCDGGSSFKGSVRDSNGQLIAGAKVIFEMPKGSVRREIETDKDGSFSAMFLHSPYGRPPIYVSAKKQGYKDYRKELPAGDYKDLQIVLERDLGPEPR